MPTTPPFDAEYDAWPIWPSKAATEAMLTIAPRSPCSSGSVVASPCGDADAVERADEVDRDDLLERVEVGGGVVTPATHGALRPADAGRVHQDAERAHALGHLDRVDDVVGAGDIDLAERAADLVGEGTALLLLQVGDHDLGAPGELPSAGR
jgi:hypothetical protein